MSDALEELEARVMTISPEEVSTRLGIERSTLDNWRWRGAGPSYIKVGGRVRYRLADLADWLDRQSRSSTSGDRSSASTRSEEE